MHWNFTRNGWLVITKLTLILLKCNTSSQNANQKINKTLNIEFSKDYASIQNLEITYLHWII